MDKTLFTIRGERCTRQRISGGGTCTRCGPCPFTVHGHHWWTIPIRDAPLYPHASPISCLGYPAPPRRCSKRIKREMPAPAKASERYVAVKLNSGRGTYA